MAGNWTPGPWKSDGSLGMIKTENRKLVAAVYGDDPDCKPDARMVANVRLIAQAPAMAEALEKLIAEYEALWMGEGGGASACEIVLKPYRAILSAIKGDARERRSEREE